MSEKELLDRIEVLENKLNAILFYLEYEQLIEEQLVSQSKMVYVKDSNLTTLIKLLKGR